MLRLIFVNRFYWPHEVATAQLLSDLAENLARRGLAVAVLASADESADSRTSVQHGVEIVRVRSTRWGKHRLLGRTVDFATFHAMAFWRLLRCVRRGDNVVALTDPPLIGITVWLAARARGATVWHWVQDIYPEVAVQVTGRRALHCFRALRNVSWRRSSGCVVPGAEMADFVRHAVPSLRHLVVSSNWAPAGLAIASAEAVDRQRAEWRLPAGKFVAMYSGNFGRVHDLDAVLDAAALLESDPDFVFVFAGRGAQLPDLERRVHSRGLSNVRFVPPQPRATLSAALGVGDVHFVTLRPGMSRFVFPSKLYGIAAASRPVLFVGDPECEIARLVRERGLGYSFARGDAPGIAATIRRLKQQPEQRSQIAAAAIQFSADGLSAASNTWHRLITGELAVMQPAR